MRELGSRSRTQAPSPHVVWDSLMRPGSWLELLDDEIEPRVLDSNRPDVVIWSSLCPGRPDDQIRFDLAPAASGSVARWTLSTPGEAPDESKIGHLRAETRSSDTASYSLIGVDRIGCFALHTGSVLWWWSPGPAVWTVGDQPVPG
jgi:hypothetical protein